MLRVYALLIVMRGVITIGTMQSITKRLGTPMRETSTDGVSRDQVRFARRVGRAIARLADKTPTNSNCYPQALTAWWLLHRKGIPTTFYYGAKFDKNRSGLETHVWLRCGPLIVTGGGVHLHYKPMTWFADESVESRGPSPS